MPKVFKKELPQEIYEYYSYGHCMHLAAALHRRLGWEIQLAIMPSDGYLPPYVDHAWVVDPKRRLCLDSDGLYPIERNGFITPNNPLVDGLSEQDLMEHTLVGSKPFTKDQWDESVSKALSVVDTYFDMQGINKLSIGNSEREIDGNGDHPPLPGF